MEEIILVIFYVILAVFILSFSHYFIHKFPLGNGVSAFSISAISIVTLHLILPIFQNIDSDFYRYSSSYPIESRLFTAVFVFGYFLFITLGYATYRTHRPISYSLEVDDSAKASFSVTSMLPIYFFLLFSLSCALYLVNIFSNVEVAEFMANRIELTRGLGYLLMIAYSGIIALLAVYLDMRVREYKATRYWLFYLFSLIYFYMYGAMGNRNFIFIFLSALFLANLYVRDKKLGFAYFLKLCIASLILTSVFSISGYMRVRIGQDIVVTDYSFFDMVIEIFNAFGNNENMLWLMTNNMQWESLNGKSFMAAVFNFIPRTIWPDKPLGAGPHLRNFILPGSYFIGGENLTSYTTGIVSESYMNFSFIGVLVGWIHGIILGIIDKYGNKNIRLSAFSVAIYTYSIVMFGFVLFYSEFLGFFAKFSFSIVVILLLKFISTKQAE